ncbi:MAG: polysaccharide biosynthesis/export family protein, partial [Cyanobacteria bacterium J06636_28]
MLSELAIAQSPPGLEQDSLRNNFTDQSSLSFADRYVLGVGDQIKLDIFEIPEIQNIQQTVLVDGTITLPWLGKVSVAGLTPQETEQTVANLYDSYLYNPLVTVNVLQPRPLQVGIVGEVKRPGGYTLRIGTEAVESNISQQRIRYWPTLTQAIQAAGGITRL